MRQCQRGRAFGISGGSQSHVDRLRDGWCTVRYCAVTTAAAGFTRSWNRLTRATSDRGNEAKVLAARICACNRDCNAWMALPDRLDRLEGDRSAHLTALCVKYRLSEH